GERVSDGGREVIFVELPAITDKNNLTTAITDAFPVVTEAHFVPEDGDAIVVIGRQTLNIVPAAGFRTEQAAALEDFLDRFLRHRLSAQDVRVDVVTLT